MAETVNSGSVEPDQANTCEGNKRRYMIVRTLRVPTLSYPLCRYASHLL